MPKLLLWLVACALLACSSDSTTTAGDAGGAGGKDAGGSETDRDAGNDEPASQLARPPGSLERPPKSGLPADLRPPKE